MKKLLGLAIVLVIFLGCANSAFAENFFTREEMEDPWNAKVMVSWVNPAENEAGSGVNVQGRIVYDWNQWLAFGGEIGFTSFGEDKYKGVKLGHYWGIPILADIILQLPLDYGDYIVVPYLVNGLGVSINHFEEDGDMKRAGWDMDVDASFIYKLGFGIDFFISEWFALNFETSYQWSGSDANVSGPGITGDNGDRSLDAFYLGGGASIQF